MNKNENENSHTSENNCSNKIHILRRRRRGDGAAGEGAKGGGCLRSISWMYTGAENALFPVRHTQAHAHAHYYCCTYHASVLLLRLFFLFSLGAEAAATPPVLSRILSTVSTCPGAAPLCEKDGKHARIVWHQNYRPPPPPPSSSTTIIAHRLSHHHHTRRTVHQHLGRRTCTREEYVPTAVAVGLLSIIHKSREDRHTEAKLHPSTRHGHGPEEHPTPPTRLRSFSAKHTITPLPLHLVVGSRLRLRRRLRPGQEEAEGTGARSPFPSPSDTTLV